MKGILRGAYCVALSISIFLCGVILALSCRGITLYKKELLQNGMTVAITLFMAACIVMLCVYGKDKLQTTRRKFSVFMFLLIGLAQIAFLLLVSRPMTIADPARVQNEALAMLKYHHGQMDPTNSYMQNYGNNQFITICFYYFGYAAEAAFSAHPERSVFATQVISYVLCWVVAAVTLISGVKYLWDNRHFINTAK